jgi:putative hydrolase of HD superfamily
MLAKLEGVDPYKVVMMCLLHDVGEIRTGDHNWIHKRYVKIFEDEVLDDQLGSLPFTELKEFASEYHERESKESLVAKDADLLDQILLLREYQMQGNQEATVWLYGKGDAQGNEQLNKLKLQSSKELGKAIYTQEPSAWWNNLWTDQNR